MASIIDITNPLTGAVEKVDQLDHTAQEIDSAVSRALPGGEIDGLLANKAPAGYGLGGNAVTVASWDDVAANGWYGSDGNAPTSDWWIGHCEMSINQYSRVVTAFSKIGDVWCEARRTYEYTTGWSAWEWVNPPMLLGVEYRTTERYLGNPVYYKLWNYGYLPATATLDVAHGIENIKSIWVDLSKSVITASANFADSSFENLSPIHPLISRIHPRLDSDGRPAISITTTSHVVSNYQAALCLKYTKTTD